VHNYILDLDHIVMYIYLSPIHNKAHIQINFLFYMVLESWV